jgi:hypothetical protein
MAKVFGCAEWQRRPEVTEAEFEQAARDLVAQPTPAGWRLSFLKADRGAHAGSYLRLWEIDSTALRDRYVTADGVTAECEQWFADNPAWVAAHDKLSSLADELWWSDYAVFTTQS